MVADTEAARLKPFRAAPATAVLGDAVVFIGGGAVKRWSPKDGAVVTLGTPTRVMALARGGGGAWVVTNDAAARTPQLARADASALTPIAPQPALANRTEFLAVTAANVFAADARALDVFDRATGERLHHEAFAADELATCTPVDDGVVFYQAGTIVRLGPGATRATYQDSGLSLHYAAGADRDHLWATSASSVSLVSLASGQAKVERTVAIPGVYHLASVDGDAAVLSVAMKAGAWDMLTVTVVGTDGAIRWTKALPAPKRQFAEVAGGSGHVAVVLDGTLHLFKAADGAAVTP